MTRRSELVEFAVARRYEDGRRAQDAVPGYAVEVTTQLTSELHAVFARHFTPERMIADCTRKFAIVKSELAAQLPFRR